MKRKFYTLITLFLALAGFTRAQTPELNLSLFSSGFDNPVGIFHAGDTSLYVVEQKGKIIKVSATGVANATPFLDITNQVTYGGERGLLGLAFHPDFATNGYFFVNYTGDDDSTVIARFQVSSNPDVANAGSEQVLLTIAQPYANHNGGNIMFGPDGYLYIGMGDGGSGGDPQNFAQNTQSLLGKMLRIDVNSVPYSVPSSNPFVGNAATLNEIWSIGLRNPWRFSFDRITGDMWIGDVGQNSWEEINFEPANTGGLNYGWRCYEADNPFNTTGCLPQTAFTFPVSGYQNNSTNGCSVTGGFMYRGGKYGRLYGHYLFTDYCSGRFRSVKSDGAGGFTTTQLEQFLPFQYASLGEDFYGELYVAGKGNGNIYRIEETTCEPTAVILNQGLVNLTDTLKAIYGEENTYQWFMDGQAVSGATNVTHITSQMGNYHVVVTNANNCTANSDTVIVTIIDGIEENFRVNNLRIFPNPAQKDFTLTFQVQKSGPVTTEIINTLGQIVYSNTKHIEAGDQQVPISVPSAAKGMYLLRLSHPTGVAITRFVLE